MRKEQALWLRYDYSSYGGIRMNEFLVRTWAELGVFRGTSLRLAPA